MTLVELLVVIAIISVIVSAIVVASLSALKAAQIKGTRGVMQKIAAALAQYRQEYKMYVPSGVDGIDENPREDSTYPLWQALEHVAKYSPVPAANRLVGTTDPQDSTIIRYKYVDAWKQPLWYQCPPLDYDTASNSWVPEAGDFSRFRIISSGPDLEMGKPKVRPGMETEDTPLVNEWGDNIIVE